MNIVMDELTNTMMVCILSFQEVSMMFARMAIIKAQGFQKV